MKTALHFKVLTIALLLPLFVVAGGWNGKHTKEKTIHKEYDVSATATLEVDNSYGNIDITTWNENRIVIDVTITTNGNNEEKVQKKLDQIDVDFNASSNFVSAKTRFGKNKSSWWNWGNSNVSMKIHYVIKMPMSNSVDLDNDYGNIDLDKLEGRAEINCDYGKITTKELMANDNELNFDYTKNSYFEYVGGGTINADYSGYTIGTTKDLLIEADYTKSVIEVAEDVRYNCDYGSLNIDKANNIVGDGDYLSLRIGEVYQNVEASADYGSIKVDRMTANAGSVTVNSDYTKITIGFDASYAFDFELDLQYTSFRGKDEVEVNKEHIKSGDKYYAGYHKSANSGNKIKINAEYGSVTFDKN